MGICRQPCLFTWGASSMVHFACIWECIQIPDAKLFTSQKWREWMQNHECLDPPKKKKLVLTHPHVGLLENRVPQSPTVYHNLQVSHRWLQYIPFPPKKCVWLFKKKRQKLFSVKSLGQRCLELVPPVFTRNRQIRFANLDLLQEHQKNERDAINRCPSRSGFPIGRISQQSSTNCKSRYQSSRFPPFPKGFLSHGGIPKSSSRHGWPWLSIDQWLGHPNHFKTPNVRISQWLPPIFRVENAIESARILLTARHGTVKTRSIHRGCERHQE